jgi:hypothetical protein
MQLEFDINYERNVLSVSSVLSRKIQIFYFHIYSVIELRLWACAIAACRRNRRECAAANAKRFINNRILIIFWHVDPLLGNDRETTRQPSLLGNSP